jgi:DNA polymerase V
MIRGGKRTGAGRPKGSGKYGEETIQVRIPRTRLTDVREMLEGETYECPLFGAKVSAGIPFGVDDFQEEKLDLNRHLIRRPATTFFVRVSGDSMIDAGIQPNDLLVIDRSVSAQHGDIVIAVIDTEVTVKRLHRGNGTVTLMPENPKYNPIPITDDMTFELWGVVTSVIHQFR